MRDIFPQIAIKSRQAAKIEHPDKTWHIKPAQLMFHTYVRIFRGGKWYEVEVNQDYTFAEDIDVVIEITKYTLRFVEFAYLTQQLWMEQTPNGTSIRESGTPLSEPDRMLIRRLIQDNSLIDKI